MVHHSACPLCTNEEIRLQFSCNDHFVTGRTFGIFKCSSCGFIFTQDSPDESEIAQFYESDEYISHSDSAKGFTNKVYRNARSLMLKRKKNLINKITRLRTGTLLDIGSGTGYFAGVMKKSGWLAKGIEINEKARTFSISHFGLEVYPPERIPTFEKESFDCITLWHVLEHFHDPFNYISEIRRLLKPGAVCVIALPNSGSFDARHYDRFWAAWDVPRHLWHFTPATFRLFAEKSGLILENLKILPLDVFYISQLSEKYKGSMLPFVTGMIKATFFAFLSFINKSKSSSVIYILRKPAG
jgi:2-polyprenyl-3-methyl-5-hydroxy-6-metoxy-1,4-benzoquinol methylase